MKLKIQTTSYLKILKDVKQRSYDRQLKELKRKEKELKAIYNELESRNYD